MVVITAVVQKYVEKCHLSYSPNDFFSTRQMLKTESFQQEKWRKFFKEIFHRKSFHIPQRLWNFFNA